MRLLIVEPDAASARFLTQVSGQQRGIAEVRATDSVQSSLQCIGEKAPDLLIIEMEVGLASGGAVLRAINPETTSAIALSQSEHHAFKAFSMGAVDYLVKPVSAAQFIVALQRAQHLRRLRRPIPAPTATSAPSIESSSQLIGERSSRYYFIAVSDVDFIEAYGNYVKIHVGAEQYLRRDTLRRLAAVLRDSGFQRVTRSTLINLKRVTYTEKCGEGALAFNLGAGRRLVSRTRFKFDDSYFAFEKPRC